MLEDRGHLAAWLVGHLLAPARDRCRRRDQHSILVVLVTRGHVEMAGNARDRAEKMPDSGPCSGGMASPFAPSRCRRDELPPIDLKFDVEQRRIHGLVAFAHQQVREEDHRALIAVGDIEGQGRGGEAIRHAERGDDDPREVALAGAKGLVQIPLLGLGRHARGRAGAHHVDDHDRSLAFREADRFRLRRGRRREGAPMLRAPRGGPDAHVYPEISSSTVGHRHPDFPWRANHSGCARGAHG